MIAIVGPLTEASDLAFEIAEQTTIMITTDGELIRADRAALDRCQTCTHGRTL